MKQLLEFTFNDVARKQRSITSLFPTFFTRVRNVNNKGGVRLVKVEKEKWVFKVHSGTKNTVWYDVIMYFDILPSMIIKYSKDKMLWVKDGSRVDHNKLAKKIFFETDLKMSCSDPSFLYYGFDYILTQRDAKYGDPENRSPDIKNPKQYGAVCKHIQALLNVLPAYLGSFAKFLSIAYKSEITSAENTVKQEAERFSKAADFLKRRKDTANRTAVAELDQEEENIEEPEEGEDNV